MKKLVALLFAMAFPAVASAQGTTCDLIPGPCAERAFRQAYAPVDRIIGAIGPGGYYDNFGYGTYGYGYGRPAAIATGMMGGMATGAALGAGFGHTTRSALIGAGAGAAAGGLITYLATRPRGGQGYYTPDGQQVIWDQPKAQKPLDCRKGKNRAACDAVRAELAFQQEAADQERKAADDEAKHQGCLASCRQSSWRLHNTSAVWSVAPTINNQPLMVCGEQMMLQPLQTIRILPLDPNDQVSGKMVGAAGSGKVKRFDALVEEVNRPGFTGFIFTAPGAPKGGN